MARHIDHIIHPAGNPVIAICVAPAAIAGEIFARIGHEIGLHEPLVVAIDGAHLPRPGIGQHQIAFAGPIQHLAIGIDDFGDNAK